MVLENEEFDYLYRTNTSSYVNLKNYDIHSNKVIKQVFI